jgi:CBS domain-containing protein
MVKKRTVPTPRPRRAVRKPVSFEDLTVADIMRKPGTSAKPDMKATEVAALMLKGIGSMPILDKANNLVGVVSEHDLLLSLDQGNEWRHQRAKEIMSANPYSVPIETTVATLVHVLTESDLLSVPVVDARNRLVGIVSRRDVVKAMLRRGTQPPTPGRM